MKKLLLLLFVIMMVSMTTTYGQSKKEMEESYAKCIISKDSIQKLYTGLAASHETLNKTYDSINKAYIAYDSMYRVIKEKVILHDFNPMNTSKLLDSLRASRNLSMSGITTIYSDSISGLRKQNAVLQSKVDSLQSTAKKENTDVVGQLKQLKELLDAQIITQAEFDAKKAILLEKL
jgi:hypothetical protein